MGMGGLYRGWDSTYGREGRQGYGSVHYMVDKSVTDIIIQYTVNSMQCDSKERKVPSMYRFRLTINMRRSK